MVDKLPELLHKLFAETDLIHSEVFILYHQKVPVTVAVLSL